jgi:hexosaminidase
MLFWGDVIHQHPELIPELPRDAVALEWGYEAGHPWDERLGRFNDAGLPFFVCPGTSSWCSIGGRTDNALANLREAAESGLKHEAAGYLITDWGDWGHVQPLPVSYLGFAAGAAYAWAYQANKDLDAAAALNAHVFRDRGNVMGQVARDLGLVHRHMPALANGTRLFWTLLATPDRGRLFEGVTAEQYALTRDEIGEIASRLAGADMRRADAPLVIEEFALAADLLAHGCRRGRRTLDPALEELGGLRAELTGLIGRYHRVWLKRNREGGLSDSVARFNTALADYG